MLFNNHFKTSTQFILHIVDSIFTYKTKINRKLFEEKTVREAVFLLFLITLVISVIVKFKISDYFPVHFSRRYCNEISHVFSLTGTFFARQLF